MANRIKLNFGPGEIEWEPSSKEVEAAWEIYVELETRVAGFPAEVGVIREALTSLSEVFGECRSILRSYGPEIARHRASVGNYTIAMLNGYLRPFLSKWHPRLLSFELLSSNVDACSRENDWSSKSQFLEELRELQINIQIYIEGFRLIAGVSGDS